MTSAASLVQRMLQRTLARPATLGAGRLICIDGPAGSGKTSLAADISALAPEARVIHMDDLYSGWSGLSDVDHRLDGLLTPLRGGQPGSYRRYDWVMGHFTDEVVVEPAPLIVLEGVGSGVSRFGALITLLVWIEAPHDLRMARGLARDGEAFAVRWQDWARDEIALFARENTRERADVVVDGTRPLV